MKKAAEAPALVGYVGLPRLAAYSGLGVTTLRRALVDPVAPLPHYRLPGKILVKLADFDVWVRRYQADGRPGGGDALAAIVEDVMAGLT